ncbi:hypothetical protein BJ138DRAFT_1108059, partial [Hygrophoropsis aurantiaca]
MYTINPAVGSQLVKYFNGVMLISVRFKVAGLALLTYEYLITLGAEVHCMWGRKWWNVARLAFTCTRYMTFIGAGMTVYGKAHFDRILQIVGLPPLTLNMGKRQTLHPAIHIISIVTAEGLLILRTYAFSHQSKPVLIFLIVFGTGCLVASVTTTMFISLPSLPVSSVGKCVLLNGEPPQDFPFQVSRSSALQYVWLATFEVGLLSLTIFKRFQDYRDSTTPLINVLYRDGVSYMVTIFATSLMNVLITLFTPAAYNEVLDTLQLVLHSILASRILFNLREVDEVAHRHQFTAREELSLQPMAFQNPQIGA